MIGALGTTGLGAVVPVENFRRSRNKLAYAYHVTPRG